jgi:hypothetical protein
VRGFADAVQVLKAQRAPVPKAYARREAAAAGT